MFQLSPHIAAGAWGNNAHVVWTKPISARKIAANKDVIAMVVGITGDAVTNVGSAAVGETILPMAIATINVVLDVKDALYTQLVEHRMLAARCAAYRVDGQPRQKHLPLRRLPSLLQLAMWSQLVWAKL